MIVPDKEVLRREATQLEAWSPPRAIENAGTNDVVLNLGFMLANSRSMVPSAVDVTATDQAGEATILPFVTARSVRRFPHRSAGGRSTVAILEAMRQCIALPGALAIAVSLGATGAWAQDEAVPPDKIPKAVMVRLLAKFPKAKIDTCTRTKEGDAVVYDIEFRQQSGRKGEADIKEDGTFINYEKETDARALPRAVRNAIETRYPKSSLKTIMEETEVMGRDEKRSAYEVILMTGDKKDVEVRVSPEGEILEDTGSNK